MYIENYGIRIVTHPEISIVGTPSFLPANLPDDITEKWETGQEDNAESSSLIMEVAGRNCYHSWSNLAGRTNEEYLKNIIQQGHESVLEHVMYNFYIRGVSRTLTHELIRHRVGTAISQRSQRYVDESKSAFVLPPELVGRDNLVYIWATHCLTSLVLYDHIVKQLSECSDMKDPVTGKVKIKQVRESARSVLPGCVETDLVWSCNLREIRHILSMRGNEHADREIRRFAVELYKAIGADHPCLFDFELYEENGQEFVRKVD